MLKGAGSGGVRARFVGLPKHAAESVGEFQPRVWEN
jgi:hypothetical protein